MMALKLCTTPCHIPESNGKAKFFGKTFKRYCLYIHDLPDARTIMGLLPLWFEDYHINHPHKGLKRRSPRE